MVFTTLKKDLRIFIEYNTNAFSHKIAETEEKLIENEKEERMELEGAGQNLKPSSGISVR